MKPIANIVFLLAVICTTATAAETIKPPTDNPFATSYRVQTHWTDNFVWKTVVDAREVKGLIRDGQKIDSLALHKAMDSISMAGGGVLFFPAGNYHLDFDVRLACGVVIRGDDIQNTTKFEFPKYQPSFKGNGTPTTTAFKKIYSDSKSSCMLGLVNVDLNRVHIVLHNAENKPQVRNQQVFLYGLRQNNAGVCHPDIPTPIQTAEGKGWQRWLFSFTGAIDIGNAENCTISRCTLNDSITDNYDQPGYLTDFGHKFSGEQSRFDFSRQNGILINAHHFQTSVDNAVSRSPMEGEGEMPLEMLLLNGNGNPSQPALIEVLDCNISIDKNYKAILSPDSLDRNEGNKITYIENTERVIDEHGRFAVADYWNKDLFSKKTFETKSGQVLNYRQLTPVNYNPDEAYPLVLFLHGGGESGDDNTSQLKHFVSVFGGENLTRYPAFVIAPQCPEGERWSNWPKDETWVLKSAMDLVKDVSAKFNIDKDRIYLVGLANRASWEIMIRHPKTFAAGVVMSTTWKFSTSDLKKLSKTPIWMFNGEKDQYNPVQYAEVSILKMKKAGFKDLHYTIIPDQGIWTWIDAANNTDLLTWMYSKRK